jgi:hypothetical protein
MRELRGWAVLGFSLFFAVASACGEDEPDATPRPGAGAGAAGDAGDELDAAPALAKICVTTPAPAAPAGDASCPAPKPASGDALDDAFAQAGVDRCSYGFSDQTMAIWKPIFADDAYQLPAFRPLHQGLLRLPAHAAETESWLDAALDGEHPLSSAILVAAARQGHTLDRCFDPAALSEAAGSATPLADAIALLAAGGAAPLEQLRAETSGVPLELQRALVPVLGAIEYAGSELSAALGTNDPVQRSVSAMIFRARSDRSGRRGSLLRSGPVARLRQLARCRRPDQSRWRRSVRTERRQYVRLRIARTRRAVRSDARCAPDDRRVRGCRRHGQLRRPRGSPGGSGRGQLELSGAARDGRSAGQRTQRRRRPRVQIGELALGRGRIRRKSWRSNAMASCLVSLWTQPAV